MDPKVAPNHDKANEPRQASAQENGDSLDSVAIPDHKLLRRIGRGSYGTVWLARNSLGAFRAIKIVFRKSFSDQRPFEREWSGIRKFEPISRSHEGFIDVLHVGINEQEGYFYYVMELGDDCESGQKFEPESYAPHTLAKAINRRGALPVKDCLRLGLALSDALGELHRCGLVHRDIKPSNIIFVNGAPKLADIGLVAGLDDSRSYVGTEGFIPPEGPGSPQADVYSLGKVLYEACTGKDRQDFPELPTLVENLEDRQQFLELNEVILHACKNEAANRYQSASSMHADLVVLANGKSVKRLKLLERRLSNLKRGAGLATVAAGVVALLSYPTYQGWRLHLEHRQQQIGASIVHGINDMDSGDMTAALPFFADAFRLDKGSVERAASYRLRFGSILDRTPKLTSLWFVDGEATAGAFSPRDDHALISRHTGSPQLYEVCSGQSAVLPYHLFHAESARYSPNGQFIVVAGADTYARVWETQTRTQQFRLGHPQWVAYAEFSPDGRHLVTACRDGFARLWSAETGKMERSFGPHSAEVAFARFSHDGRLVATASQDNTCRLWNVADGTAASPALQHENWVNHVAFSPDDHLLITASWDRKARVWETATGRHVLPNLTHNDGVKSAEFSPDGRLIVTASADGTARLWDAATLQPLQPNWVVQNGDRVTDACFASDGHRVLTTSADGSVRIWDLAGSLKPGLLSRRSFSADMSRCLEVTNSQAIVRNGCSGKLISQISNLEKVTNVVRLNRNGQFVFALIRLSPGPTNPVTRLRVWNANTGLEVSSDMVFTNSVSDVALSDDGGQAAFFGPKVAQVWDVRTGKTRSPLLHHPPEILQAEFNRDGTQLATRSGSTVRVWDCIQQREAFAPLEHLTNTSYLGFSPDGKFLVTCCSDQFLTKCYAQVWNATTGKPVGPRLGHADGVLQADFCPDGRRLVTASEDFTAMVWDFRTGKQLVPPLRHQYRVMSASFSPDGKWLVTTTADDEMARIWDTETGDPLGPPVHSPVGLSVAKFLPDSRAIAVLSIHGEVWQWPLRVDPRPLEDLSAMARLLSGGPVELHGGAHSGAEPEPVDATWQRLAAKYPSDFTVSNDQIAAWHELQAEQSEAERNWFAMVFHLNRLLLLRPGDPALLARLAAAQANLKSF
jgi:WD40 repeat protein/serine/threonine protein kinase